MHPANTLYQIDQLETASRGDYSFIQVDESKKITYRKSVIKHNGGCFYCFAHRYDEHKTYIREVSL